MGCNGFKQDHEPLANDLVDGNPKNSSKSNVRISLDGRKGRCVYYRKFEEKTDHYNVNLDLCLYHQKSENSSQAAT